MIYSTAPTGSKHERAIPTAKQQQIWDLVAESKPGGLTLIGYGGAAGGGKRYDVNEYVPTPTGYIRNGDLKAGDIVFGEHGQPVVVKRVHPVVDGAITYRLVFDDGSEARVCADHLWLTYDARELEALTKRTPEYRERRRNRRPSRATGLRTPALTAAVTVRNITIPTPTIPPPTGTVRTTQQIADTLYVRNGTRANHAIPVAGALQLPEAPLPIDPYVFGLWLGDGSKRGDTFASADPELIGHFSPWLNSRRRGYNYGLRGLRPLLSGLGVLNNKHIPMIYLRASREQRLALLQGLMDTDGTVCDQGAPEFSNTNKNIIDGVYDLICGLGWKARIREGRAMLDGRDCGPKWDIKWTPSEYVFRLPRKRDKQKLATRRTTRFRYIVKAERIAPIPMRCITVDNPSGLYLAGKSMLVTHNSRAIVELAYDLATDFPGTKILIGRKDFSDLRTTTLEQFDMHCPRALLWRKNDSEHWRELRLADWPEGVVSRVVFRELKDFMGLGSEEYGAVLIDEAGEVPRKSALMLLSRLRWRLPRIIMSTPRTKETPWGRKTVDYPGGKPPKFIFMAASNPWPGWFEDWFVKREMDEDLLRMFSGSVHFIPALPSDNPHLPSDYEARLRALYPAEWVKRLMDGRWDAFEGQVYPEFSERKHCWRAALPAPEHWASVIGGLDFGGQNPYDHFSAGIVAIVLKSNRIIRVAEFKERGPGVYDKQIAWMLAQEARWCNKYTGRKLLWVADKTQMVAIHQWNRMGFRVKPSKGGPRSVDFGISQVKRRLDIDASGYPGSFYLPELEHFAEDMKVYRYAEPKDDEGVVKREPIKRGDDLCDADRYMHERLERTYGPPEEVVRNLMPIVVPSSGLALPFPLAGGVPR